MHLLNIHELGGVSKTFYQLGSDSTILDSKIQDLVKQTILHTPKLLQRTVYKDCSSLHKWAQEYGKPRKQPQDMSGRQFPSNRAAHQRLGGAYGTVRYDALSKMILISWRLLDTFFETRRWFSHSLRKSSLCRQVSRWSDHTSAMHQYVREWPVASEKLCTNPVVWTALEAEGLGSKSQHYNPVIDTKVDLNGKLPARGIWSSACVW